SDGNLYGASGPGESNTFYSYSVATGAVTAINGDLPYVELCLERSDGTFLGIENNSGNPQAVKIAFDGAVTPIAQFPTTSYLNTVVCPAEANDGNYYGTSVSGGKYGYGYAYQLTSSGALNIFYNYTGQGDDAAPDSPPVQASD